MLKDLLYYITLYYIDILLQSLITSLLNTTSLSVLCMKPEILNKQHDSISSSKFLKLLNFERFSLLWIAMSEKSLLASRKCYVLQRWLGWSPSPAWQWPKATDLAACSVKWGGLAEVTRWDLSIQRGSCNISSPVNKSAGLPSTAEYKWWEQACQVKGVHCRM